MSRADAWYVRFARWLEQEPRAYRTNTIKKLCTDVHTLVEHGGIPISTRTARTRDFQWVWDLWEEFRAESGAPALGVERPADPEKRRRRREGRRAREAVSIDPAEWRRLRELVRGDARIEARVIEVLMATALRISDVHRATPEAIEQGLRREDGLAVIEVKGGKKLPHPVHAARMPWRRLVAAANVDVWLDGRARRPVHFADAVAPGSDPEAGGAAYQRVRTVLLELGARAGVTGPVHLHRLRRSIAVHLLDDGAPKEIVQALLGHSDSRTTDGYVDEHRVRAAGAAMERLNRR